MARPAVLVIGPHLPLVQAAVESKGIEYHCLWEQPNKEAFLAEKGPLFRGLVSAGSHSRSAIDDAFLRKVPNVEIVASLSAGMDGLDIPLIKSRGLLLTDCAGANTDGVAEAAVALLLATVRQVLVAERFIRDGNWAKGESFHMTHGVSNKYVGVIGLGQIGAAVAKRLESFGCSIGYWGRAAKAEQFPNYEFHHNVVALAKRCNFLIAACALTDETRKLINREVLDALGSQGFLVNIARGGIVDEAELVKALVEGRIAGAGLDVFENEPHVSQELLSLETVVLQPHTAFGTFDVVHKMAELGVANLAAHFAGQPLLSPYH